MEVVEQIPPKVRGRPKTIFSEEERIARIRQSQREYRARNIYLCRERVMTWESAHREERCAQKRALYRKNHPIPENTEAI